MASFGSIAAALKRNKSAPPPAETPARRFNTDDISVQLQRALAPLQIESLSLHNALGDLIWRNDGVFGDDEQAMVLDALDMFAIDERREDLRLKLDDDRSALFAIARDTTQVMRGLALVIVETPGSEELSAKLNSPRLQTQMRRFAQLLVAPAAAPAAPAAAAASAATAAPTAPAATDDSAETLLVSRQPMVAEEFTARPDMTVALSPGQTSDLLRESEPEPAFDPGLEFTPEPMQVAEVDPQAETMLAPAPVAVKAAKSPAQDAFAAASAQGFGSMEVIELSGEDSTQTALPAIAESAEIPTVPALTAVKPVATPSPFALDLSPASSPVAARPTPAPSLPAAAPAVAVERRAKPAPEPTADARANSIRARRYTRLRAGGAARRYEVKPSPDASFKGDLALTTMVAMHVQRSGDRYTQTPSTFTVPVSVDSVTQSGWVSKVQSMLTRNALPRGMLGFSLSPAIWRDQAAAAERFIAECEAIGCFIALDDFSLHHTGLSLLRSAAVKCLKLDPRLLAAVVNDRFSHAQLVAIVQAARVLGLYCVAKQVASTSQVKWLTSAGIEFADGVGRGVVIAIAKREPSEV
jgi:EAL domain-containing protein